MSDAMDRAALGRQLLHANGPVADHEWASVGAALARENERLREALSRLSAASLDQLPGEAVGSGWGLIELSEANDQAKAALEDNRERR